MKLAVDIHHLLLENAGTKRVTVNLLEQLKKATEINLLEFKPEYTLKQKAGIIGKIQSHFIRLFWVQIHLPYLCWINKVDILLSPEFNTPLFTTCKRAVIVHDAHMRAQRKYTSSLWFYFYYIPFVEFAIRHANLIFTVSNFAKTQIVRFMRLNEKKVQVVYNGLDKSFLNINGINKEDIKLPEGLISNNYILFVGTFETRKNIERLIQAFSKVKQSNPATDHIKLAIAGGSSASKFSDRSNQISSLIGQLNLGNEIVLCGYIADIDLPHLYQNSLLIAFPSLYEGFGLPIIEGFASCVPVLTSNICSMPEIAGDAAVLADPYDINDLAEKIEKIIFDPVLRSELIAAGNKRLRFFSWEKSAAQITHSLTQLL
ncbi:MAG: glycosyltransferase family 4 protein [Flavobacterium sp.]|nr:glycosyltransferase family 4 protein [Pedobacter sp.]